MLSSHWWPLKFSQLKKSNFNFFGWGLTNFWKLFPSKFKSSTNNSILTTGTTILTDDLYLFFISEMFDCIVWTFWNMICWYLIIWYDLIFLLLFDCFLNNFAFLIVINMAWKKLFLLIFFFEKWTSQSVS